MRLALSEEYVEDAGDDVSGSGASESGLGWPSEAVSAGIAETRRQPGEAVGLGWPGGPRLTDAPNAEASESDAPRPADAPHEPADVSRETVPASPSHDESSPPVPQTTPEAMIDEPTGEGVDTDVTEPSEQQAIPAPAETSAPAAHEPPEPPTEQPEQPARPTAPGSPARRLVRPKGAPWARPDRTRVVTIANQKGGVGKTTTAVNLAASLSLGGQRVLVIDTDPQGNASTALGIDHSAEVPSIYDVLVDDVPLAEVVQECPLLPGLQCVPATIELAGAEIELVSFVARETRLQRAIQAHLAYLEERGEHLDYIVIDCPPSLGLLTINAFVAGEEVLIPIQCEYYALEGLSMLVRNIDMIRRHLNPRLHISTILLTMYDARTRLSSQVADEVRSHFADQVLKAMVPRSVRVSEAPSHGETVLTYDPMSTGSLAYLDAAKEFAGRAAPQGSDREA